MKLELNPSGSAAI